MSNVHNMNWKSETWHDKGVANALINKHINFPQAKPSQVPVKTQGKTNPNKEKHGERKKKQCKLCTHKLFPSHSCTGKMGSREHNNKENDIFQKLRLTTQATSQAMPSTTQWGRKSTLLRLFPKRCGKFLIMLMCLIGYVLHSNHPTKDKLGIKNLIGRTLGNYIISTLQHRIH